MQSYLLGRRLTVRLQTLDLRIGVRNHAPDHWRSRPSLADSNIGAEHATSTTSLSETYASNLIEAYDSRQSQSTAPAFKTLEREGFVRMPAAKNVQRISA